MGGGEKREGRKGMEGEGVCTATAAKNPKYNCVDHLHVMFICAVSVSISIGLESWQAI